MKTEEVLGKIAGLLTLATIIWLFSFKFKNGMLNIFNVAFYTVCLVATLGLLFDTDNKGKKK